MSEDEHEKNNETENQPNDAARLQSSKDLLYAILSSQETSEFQCGKCLNMYKSNKTLSLHMKLKHPPESDQARCEICNKVYSSLLSLQKHVHYLHRFEHRCLACYRGFRTSELLAAHRSTSCRGDNHSCDVCGKLFNTRLALSNHNNYMHPNRDINNRCNHCNRVFVNERGLRNHINVIHPDEHTCKVCKATFYSTVSLKAHESEAHSGIVLKCALCYKRFRSEKRHERHMSEYHGPHTPHKCSACGKVLRTAVSLQNHKRVVHNGVEEDGDHVIDLTI